MTRVVQPSRGISPKLTRDACAVELMVPTKPDTLQETEGFRQHIAGKQTGRHMQKQRDWQQDQVFSSIVPEVGWFQVEAQDGELALRCVGSRDGVIRAKPVDTRLCAEGGESLKSLDHLGKW